MGMPVTTAEQKVKWLDALNVASNAAAEPNKCVVVGLYQWQQAVIPALKSEAEDCQHAWNTINTLHSSLTTVIKSIRADEAIATILSEPLKTTTVNEAAYQAEIDSWSKASASLRAVDAPNEATGVKTAAITAAEAIKTAWSALMAANTAQNASQYQTALSGLSEAYGGLNNVSSESKKALQTAAGAVQKAYSDAF
jgi:ribosomal protein S19E (S16A)